MLKKIVGLGICFWMGLALSAADLEVFNVQKGSIKLDGRLTEPAWKKAQKASGFRRLTNLKNKVSLRETNFSVLADDYAIYLGIKCAEKDMANFKANVKITDNPHKVWKDDVLELFFCPTGQDDVFYQFVLAAGGGKWSQYSAEKGAIKPDPFRPYWETAVFKGKDFWSVEVIIPWAAFYMTDSRKFKKEWLMNIARQHAASSSRRSTWSKLKFAFKETENFNKVGDFPIKPYKYDIFIKSAVPKVEIKKSDFYIGKTEVVVESRPKAKGDYKLRIKIDGKEYDQKVTLKGRPIVATFKNVEFKNLGKSWMALELLDTSGKLVTGRYYPIKVEYIPIAWMMDKPLYKKSFFPGQDPTLVKGALKLNLSPSLLKSAIVEMSIKPDQLQAQTIKVKPVDGIVRFEFKLKSKKYSKAAITAEVLMNGKAKFSSVMNIRNLPPKKGMKILYVENGVLHVDGKPRFYLNFFARTWKVGAAFLEKHPDAAQVCPEIDRNAGCIGLNMNRLIRGMEAKEGTKDIMPCEKLLAKIREKVLKYRDKSSFWFYYLADEPECRNVSPVYLKHLYDFITELDPYHPLYIISRTPGRYIDCSDVVSSHAYTNPLVDADGKLSLGNPAYYFRITAASFNRIRPKDTALNYCPQIFTYAFINSCSVYPKFDDSRASVWGAICNNATGINAYIYCGYSATADLEYGYNFLYSSIRTLEPYLVGSEKMPLSVKNKGLPVDAMLKKYDGKLLLVVSNVLNNPTKVSLESPALKRISTLHSFRESRDVTVKNGKLELEMAPFEVRLLTTVKEGADLQTLAALRQKLANVAKSIKDRGNVLRGFRYKVDFSMSPMRWNGRSNFHLAYTLFDGDLDSPGLIATPANHKKDGYFEISFTKDIPKFSKLTLHHANIKNLKVKILKYGEWREPKVVKRTDSKHKTTLDFGKTLSTVKMRLEFDNLKRKARTFYEIYELELFK